MGVKEGKVLGLFLAAALTFTPGCALDNSRHVHVDKDGDGYCDVDGAPINRNSNYGNRFYSLPHYGSTSSADPSSKISTGTAAPKSGIGTHSLGSAG